MDEVGYNGISLDSPSNHELYNFVLGVVYWQCGEKAG